MNYKRYEPKVNNDKGKRVRARIWSREHMKKNAKYKQSNAKQLNKREQIEVKKLCAEQRNWFEWTAKSEENDYTLKTTTKTTN